LTSVVGTQFGVSYDVLCK